jgi:hypothetical protein
MPIALIQIRSGALLAMLSILVFGLQAAPPQTESTKHILFQESSLSQDIAHLVVSEQLSNSFYNGDTLVVELIGRGMPDDYIQLPGVKPPARPLGDLGIEVWLLRVDGTALKRMAKVLSATGNAGWITDSDMFVFEHIAPKELAGVVVRLDGMLFVRDIHLSQ